MDKFPWIKTLSESEISFGMNLNVVKSKKIFGGKELQRHIMKVPYNISKLVLESNTFERLKGDGKAIKEWYETLKVLDGIENLNEDILNSDLFIDTCKMARTLGHKVNCRWGLKRLKEEHDKWSMDISNIILDCELEYDLKVRPIFKSFAEYSGYKLLGTNKELLREGMLQHHCVGTYINTVDKGECGIYHVDGYTLQLYTGKITNIKSNVRFNDNGSINEPNELVLTSTFNSRYSSNYNRPEYIKKIDPKFYNNVLIINQFRGKFNESAPQELHDKVEEMMIKFVHDNGFKDSNLVESIKDVSKQTRVMELGDDFDF